MKALVTYSCLDPLTKTQRVETYEANDVKERKNSMFLMLLRDGVRVAQVRATEVLSIKYLTNE